MGWRWGLDASPAATFGDGEEAGNGGCGGNDAAADPAAAQHPESRQKYAAKVSQLKPKKLKKAAAAGDAAATKELRDAETAIAASSLSSVSY
jgi:hypothetical protein